MLCSALFSLSRSHSYTLSTGHHFEPASPYIHVGSTTALPNYLMEIHVYTITSTDYLSQIGPVNECSQAHFAFNFTSSPRAISCTRIIHNFITHIQQALWMKTKCINQDDLYILTMEPYLEHSIISHSNGDHFQLTKKLLTLSNNSYDSTSHEKRCWTDEHEKAGVSCNEVDMLVDKSKDFLQEYFKFIKRFLRPIHCEFNLQM